jgi:hypothetical protein
MGTIALSEWLLLGSGIDNLGVGRWAYPVRPLFRPKAAGRLSGTVVALIAAERRNLVVRRQATFGTAMVESCLSAGVTTVRFLHLNARARDISESTAY